MAYLVRINLYMQVSNMRRFIVKILILFISLFIIDQVAGLTFKNWLTNVTTGYLGKENYICDHCTEDILIFGSSRAEYHYNAKLIEDSLGVTAYNCGASGYGIIQSYGRLCLLAERYHPKLIIMEITPEFDLVDYEDISKDLGGLKGHYDRNCIKDIFERVDPTEKFKMLSYLYRYNSNFAHNPLRLFKSSPFTKNALGNQGFRTMHKEFDKMKVGEKKEKEVFKLDEVKLFYLKKFVETARGFSQIVFVVSPYWQGRNPEIFNFAKHLADSLSIPFLDYSNNPKYFHKDKFFADGVHLNARGADEFTKDLIIELRKQGGSE